MWWTQTSGTPQVQEQVSGDPAAAAWQITKQSC